MMATTSIFCFYMAYSYFIQNKTVMIFNFASKGGFLGIIEGSEPYIALILLFLMPIYMWMIIKDSGEFLIKIAKKG